jgi:predicted amidohydrolase YtcJ
MKKDDRMAHNNSNVKQEPSDLVIINAKVITVDKEFAIRQAVAVKNGKIAAVGTDEEVKKFIGPDTIVLDLRGKPVLPGINDAHMHATFFGGTRPPLALDLGYPTIRSIRGMVEELLKKVEGVRPGEWIRGFGWDTGYLDECKVDTTRYPRKWDIDPVSPNNPVVFTDFSGHTLLVNSKALELAGITKDTPDPEGGEIEREPGTGEPTGIFKELSAQALVTKVVPLYTRDEKREAILSAIKQLNANGVTSYTDGALGPGGDNFVGGVMGQDCIDIYKGLFAEGKLTARVNIMLLFGEYGALNLKNLQKGVSAYHMPEGLDSAWLRINQVKIFADGIPPAKTAWMYEEYVGGGKGKLVLPGSTDQKRYDELINMITYIHKLGFQVGIHATGDRAIDACVDGFIKALREKPWDARHYTIHNDFTTNECAKRMAEYNIGANVQTGIKWTISDYMDSVVGEERSARQWPLRWLIDAGVHVTGSSDAPVTYPNWKQGIEAAVLRESKATGKVSGPEQRISREEAIRIYTIEGAWQDHMEDVKGSIEVGKFADLCVIGEDILTVDAHKIKDIPVVMTIVGGKIVFDKLN